MAELGLCCRLVKTTQPSAHLLSFTPENFRHFASKPDHPNRKTEYQDQHDDLRAGCPVAKQPEEKC